MTKRKRFHNSLLVLITILAVLLLWQLKNQDNPPILIVGVSCFVYLIWALIYHKLDKSLTLPIILEYVLTAGLVLIFLTGVFIS